MTTAATRIPLCALDEIAVGLGRAFVVGDTPLAVFRSRDGRVFVGRCGGLGSTTTRRRRDDVQRGW